MTEIYTDGSALKNGSKDSPGGFGVVVVKDGVVIDAYSEFTRGTTNNREEMKAILWAMENYGSSDDGFLFPIIYTDSMYCVNSFTNWLSGWKANGWVRKGNKPLENLDLIKQYDELSKTYKVSLKKIRGHAGEIYNEIADALAGGKMTISEVLREYGE